MCAKAVILLATAALPLLLCVGAGGARVYDADKIYVHIVPHTHDDVGWLKTVDEYYYGANKSIQQAAVQYILDTVIQELQKDENRTFIYVEMAFFTRWWKEQNMQTQNIVKQLVERGQLEFINGGWCMNDEASTHYNAIIDQMTLGLKFIEDTFGAAARPQVAWHIDPFGHSAEQASLFAQMGFDGFFFARNDYDDRAKRLNETTMEMVWRPSTSLGADSELFTGILYYGYGPPPGFCFDIHCGDDPIQDSYNLENYNVYDKVNDFTKAIYDQAKHYATNHIMFTMGSDFQFENALENYKNMDKIIHYTNLYNSSVELFYSTPSRYLKALHDAGKRWTVKTDDFFPYADNPYAYWTGYFTSRPALKRFTRQMNSLLQSCKQLEAMGGRLSQPSSYSSEPLQEAMGVDQHHDAVSGTEKQHVANDYAYRLHSGRQDCEGLMGDTMAGFMASKTDSPKPKVAFCHYLNISICPASEASGSFSVVVYNPVARETVRIVRFPIASNNIQVQDQFGQPVVAQIIEASEATKAVRRGRGNAPYDVIFKANIPGLGAKTYFIRPSSGVDDPHKATFAKYRPVLRQPGKPLRVETMPYVLDFDQDTGHLKKINNTLSHVAAAIDQTFLWWNSSDGNNVNSTQPSGAYIFRPNGTAPFTVNQDGAAKIFAVQGEVFGEVLQVWTPWLYQSIRVYQDLPLVEFEYTVGPIPFQDNLGKEIISRFSTEWQTDGAFYTDANGREMQKRVRYFRPTWELNSTEPVAENYYPVNSRIFIKDEAGKRQLTVLTDRSQGGSSLNDGQIELMVHRRTLYDDHRGVGEPINETGQYGDGLIIRGRHIVLLDNFENSSIYHRTIGEHLMMDPVLGFLDSTVPPILFGEKYYTNFTGVLNELPLKVHLLTLQLMDKDTFLIRLEHIFPSDEPPYNTPVDVSLSDLFVFHVDDVKELALAANTPYPVMRLKWNTDGVNRRPAPPRPVVGPRFTVSLKPMQIRTFSVKVSF